MICENYLRKTCRKPIRESSAPHKLGRKGVKCPSEFRTERCNKNTLENFLKLQLGSGILFGLIPHGT